jgi:WD40 repeat protein
VLVAPSDGKPAPKVIDFGVAKAIGQPLTEKTLVTGFGAIIGTLEYMSPEQAEFHQLDIDTRSDIYSLGVLLYELLAGSPPFTCAEMETAGVLEMLRVIREQEPTRPSTKLSTAEGLPTLAANRGMEPAKLTRMMRGELDWIVMKALEKDRNRRYETANDFALDVQRFLADEPVQAGPPSLAYRMRKFVKRNRSLVLAVMVVLLSLVAGIVGTTLGRVEADNARNEAEKSAKMAKDEERKAKSLATEEKVARNRAEWLLYASQISLSLQAWDANDPALALHYLDLCRPEFRSWEHDYLCTLFHGNQRTFGKQRTVEKKVGVHSVAVSRDGKRIVGGHEDGTIKIWDADTGQEVRTIHEHKTSVNSVAFSPDAKQIVSGGSDTSVRVFNVETGQEIWTVGRKNEIRGPILGVAWSLDGKRIVSTNQTPYRKVPGGRAAPVLDETLNVWDAATGEKKATLKGITRSVLGVAFSPDGKRIVGCGGADHVQVWDANTGAETLKLKGRAATVQRVAFSADGKRIVGGGNDDSLQVWDADTGEEVLTFKRQGGVRSVAFSPNGKHIVVGGGAEMLTVHNAATGEKTHTLKGHTGLVNSVAVMPDGRRIVSGSTDNTVKVWDLAVPQEARVLKGLAGMAHSVAWMPDSNRILRAGFRSIVVEDPDTGEVLRILRESKQEALKGSDWRTLPTTGNYVAVTPDGKRIVCGDAKNRVMVWDAVTGMEIRALNGHMRQIRCVAGYFDNRRIVSGSDDKSMKIWDVDAGREIRTLHGHEKEILSVAVSRDDKWIVSGGKDQTIKIWDADTGQEIRTLHGHAGAVNLVAWASDGKRIFSGSDDKSVKIWNADTGQEILSLQGHTAPVTSVAMTPDGRRFVTGSSDKTVRIWEAETGFETLSLKGHTSVVTGVAVSRDGKRIISGNTQGFVLIWDALLRRQQP